MASTDLGLHALGRGLGRGRRGAACLVIWHHPLVPCHIAAHRFTSSRMVMEKSVNRFAMRRTTDMRMRVTSHVIVLVMRRGGRLTRFKYRKLYVMCLIVLSSI